MLKKLEEVRRHSSLSRRVNPSYLIERSLSGKSKKPYKSKRAELLEPVRHFTSGWNEIDEDSPAAYILGR